LANGSYNVAPSLVGYINTPASQAVTINGANQFANFTAVPVTPPIIPAPSSLLLAGMGLAVLALYETWRNSPRMRSQR
jgi:hypothetical protein